MSGKKSNQSLRMPTQVNSLWPNPQLLIALHSPNAPLETGLCMCLPEISQDNTAFDAEQSVLRSPVCLRIIAKYGHCSRISAHIQQSFSALQTAWRRERDSNPRYPFRHSGFQDRLFQPLTHPSASPCTFLVYNRLFLSRLKRVSL
jgi:hypothetical protein